MHMSTDIFKLVKKCRDDYAKSYDKAVEEKMAAERYLNANVKSYSDEWRKRESEIAEQFRDSVTTAKEQFKAPIVKEVEQLRCMNEARVSASVKSPFFTDISNIIYRLDSMPIDSREAEILINHYKGKSYFTDRLLSDFAEKHGIMSIAIDADYGTVEDVLDDLLARCDQYINLYGSNNSNEEYQALDVLYDSKITTLVDRYTNGYNAVTDRELLTDRAVHAIYSATNRTEQARVIGNVLRTCKDDDLFNSIVERLREDDKIDSNLWVFMGLDKISEKVEEVKLADTERTKAEVEFDEKLEEDIKKLTPEQRAYAEMISRKNFNSDKITRGALDAVKDVDIEAVNILRKANEREQLTNDPKKKTAIHEGALQEIKALKEKKQEEGGEVTA